MRNRPIRSFAAPVLFCAALFVPRIVLADVIPGDACTGAGNYTVSSGPELSGAGHLMVCTGSVWKSVLDFDASANSTLPYAVSISGDISPSPLSSDQNNFNPSGLANASVLRLSSSAAVNITGLAGGSRGRSITIFNTGTNNIVLKNQNTSSTDLNRFAINADITLGADQSATLIYDSTSQRWRSASIPFSSGGSNSCFTTWTERNSNRNWSDIAMSSDGTKQVATVYGGRIYTSTDSGATWTARDSNRNWQSVASSTDGTKLVASNQYGNLYTSTDSGVTWTPRDTSRSWENVASSSDGTKLAAAVYGGVIYTSADSGVTWTARASGTKDWGSISSSADGSVLYAGTDHDQGFFKSTDSGATWSTVVSNGFWWQVFVSADASRIYAATYSNGVQRSINSGSSFSTLFGGSAGGVAVSSDGTTIVLNTDANIISKDSGATWTSYGPAFSSGGYGPIAISDNGKVVTAVRKGGKIYTTSCP